MQKIFIFVSIFPKKFLTETEINARRLDFFQKFSDEEISRDINSLIFDLRDNKSVLLTLSNEIKNQYIQNLSTSPFMETLILCEYVDKRNFCSLIKGDESYLKYFK